MFKNLISGGNKNFSISASNSSNMPTPVSAHSYLPYFVAKTNNILKLYSTNHIHQKNTLLEVDDDMLDTDFEEKSTRIPNIDSQATIVYNENNGNFGTTCDREPMTIGKLQNIKNTDNSEDFENCELEMAWHPLYPNFASAQRNTVHIYKQLDDQLNKQMKIND